MSTTARNPGITPIPVQLSEPEFTEFIFPHLSMPKRGPRCKLSYHCLFNLILWVLYTGMPWKCLPMPKGPTGKPELHYTNVYRAFAKWADDGSLQQAFMASVGHLSDEKKTRPPRAAWRRDQHGDRERNVQNFRWDLQEGRHSSSGRIACPWIFVAALA